MKSSSVCFHPPNFFKILTKFSLLVFLSSFERFFLCEIEQLFTSHQKITKIIYKIYKQFTSVESLSLLQLMCTKHLWGFYRNFPSLLAFLSIFNENFCSFHRRLCHNPRASLKDQAKKNSRSYSPSMAKISSAIFVRFSHFLLSLRRVRVSGGKD